MKLLVSFRLVCLGATRRSLRGCQLALGMSTWLPIPPCLGLLATAMARNGNLTVALASRQWARTESPPRIRLLPIRPP